MARIAGTKGLSGALRIELLTDWPERLAAGALVFLEGEERPRRVREIQLAGRVPIIALEGLTSREAAVTLVGRYLEVEPRALPEGSYYWHQLVGLAVTDEAGARLGEVVEVFRAGENEVYRVQSPDGGELLVPAVRGVVRRIDLSGGTMIVRYESEEVR